MSASLATPPGRMTVDQFFDWAERQPEGRFELVGGVPQRLSPERNQHLLVKGAVYRAFVEAVKAARADCLVLPDGATVVIDQYQSREPDVSVQCSRSLDPRAVTIDEPIVLVEVTSPSTMRTDTADKLIEYFALASVRHYLLVHPDQRRVVHHRWLSEGSIVTEIRKEGDVIFDPPGFTVAVERFFEDLLPVGADR